MCFSEFSTIWRPIITKVLIVGYYVEPTEHRVSAATDYYIADPRIGINLKASINNVES